MRIGIDARFYGTPGKGLGRYTQLLIENLENICGRLDDAGKSAHNHQYYIFLRKENWDEYQPCHRNFHKVLADIPWYGLREQLLMPRILNKYCLDLVHFPHFNVPYFWKGKFIVTIHDLILLYFPTRRASTLSPLFYFIKKIAYQFIIKYAIKHARIIIAVSMHTRTDILRHFAPDENKVAVTYEAVDIRKQVSTSQARHILPKYGIIKPYILYVGNAYPHKNLERLVLVFKETLKKHPHLKLCLVGKKDYFYQRLERFTAENGVSNVIFTDFVKDSDLGVIYREAFFYVFPSLYEGFGLPPLEAMARGVPVTSSNAACLPEILGKAAFYFDPCAQGEMSDAIELMISDSDLRQQLISNGYSQINKYSWMKMASETLNLYEKANNWPDE